MVEKKAAERKLSLIFNPRFTANMGLPKKKSPADAMFFNEVKARKEFDAKTSVQFPREHVLDARFFPMDKRNKDVGWAVKNSLDKGHIPFIVNVFFLYNLSVE